MFLFQIINERKLIIFNSAYNNKKVFITGHTGFKGSWLSLWLWELGAQLKGYALTPNTKNDHYIVANIDSKIESIIADIRDYQKLKEEIEAFDPDYIFHLAAQPLVRESYVTPRETFETNVMGTVNILNIAKDLKNLKSIINVTSDKSYENVEKHEGYKEEEPMGGYDPYSSSKGCSELVTRAYQRSFYTPNNNIMLASARAGNVIGGGDWCKDRIMTDTITALMNKKPILIRNPEATRPWQHVLEPLSGYLWLAAQTKNNPSKHAGGWNFGPKINKHIPVKKIVEQVIQIWGSGSWEDIHNPNELHEAKLLHLDCSKAKKQLKWEPTLTVEESVDLTVQWYKKFNESNDKNLQKISLDQIKKYTNLAKQRKNAWSL